MAKVNPDDRQIEYWQKRAELDFIAGEKKGLVLAKELKTNYEKAMRSLENNIRVFYSKYATLDKIDYMEAKKLLNKNELRSFEIELKELMNYAKKHNFTSDEKLNIKLMSLKTRISRLEELKTQMYFELTKLSKDTEDKLYNYFSNSYEDGYYKSIYNVGKTIGYKSSFARLNTKLIDKAIKKEYTLGNYSVGINKVWQNTENLMQILNQEIPRGLTLGYNAKKLAGMVNKKLDTNYNSTVRLIRTEYNYLMNQSTKDGYEACGIKQYQILATLDGRTSDICIEMNGEIFDFSKLEVGVNYPPFHPNCRTTTIPYFELDEIDEEIPIDIKVGVTREGERVKIPEGLSYKEWLKSIE